MPIHIIPTRLYRFIALIIGFFKALYWCTRLEIICRITNKKNYYKSLNSAIKIFGKASIEYATILFKISSLFTSQNENIILEAILSELMNVYLLIIRERLPNLNIEERRTLLCKLGFIQPWIFSLLSSSIKFSPEFIRKCFEFRLVVKWTLLETSDQLLYEVQFEELRDSIESDEAIIEIVRHRDFISSESGKFQCLFFIITKETVDCPIIVTLKNGNDLDGVHHKEYMASLMKKSVDFFSWERYWKDIDVLIQNKNRIFVSTDGVYRYINLNTLLSQSGKYLLEEKQFIICYDLRNLITKKALVQEYGKKAILLGNPVCYDIEKQNREIKEFLPDILSSENEIRRIAEILDKAGWQTKLFTGEEVKKEIFNTTAGIGLLHLATHGYFRGIPRKKSTPEELMYASGLLLSHSYVFSEKENGFILSDEGYLCGKDILQMNLSSVELVVLSSCESGVAIQSNTGETLGLQRTFLFAGAKSIIVTLWGVEDTITLEFMSSFYTKWVETSDLDSSFYNAQKFIKQKYRHPFYWGAFVLIHR